MNIKVLLIYHASIPEFSKTLDFKNCFSLIYREQVPSIYASSPQVFEVPLILPHLPILFRAHFQPSLTGTDQVYDLQKPCSSVAVIYGKGDIRQAVNVLCLWRYLRTDRLILLLTSDGEVLQHPCAPCWFVPILPEKGGRLDQKSPPESLVVRLYPAGDLGRGEGRDQGDNWACHQRCYPGCSAGLIVWGPHRDQMETQ